MKIPIGRNQLGAIYVIGNSAYFFTLDSAYYNNCMLNHKNKYDICTFNEFKIKYPIYIRNNYYRKDNTEG